MMRIFFLLFLFSFLHAEVILDRDRILSENLKAIIFTSEDTDAYLVKGGVQIVPPLFVPDEEDFIEEMDPFLGHPITIHSLMQMRESILHFYAEKGYSLVGVYIPKGQDVTDGTLHLLILVGKLGTLDATGAKYFSNEKLKKQMDIQKGEIIETEKLLSSLFWINQNPFHSSKLIYEQGEKMSTTDVLLVTEDRFPLRVYSGFENTGTLVAGTKRFLAGINWGNVFGTEAQANYLFLTGPSPGEWWAQMGSFIMPLYWRHIFEIYGSYTHTRPERELPENIDPTGKGWELAGRYNIPFITGYLEHNFLFGFEFKRTNNFINFGTDEIFNNFFEIAQFLAGYEATLSYSFGSSEVGALFTYSPGDLTPRNKTQNFDLERPGAKANYFYTKLFWNQVFFMPLEFSIIWNAEFQQSNHKLLPSEEFYLGGYSTVRGYDEFEVISDNGLLSKLELRSPPIPFPFTKNQPGDVQILAFFDYGYAYEADQTVLPKETLDLYSVGPAVRYNLDDMIKFRFDYGFQLKKVRRSVEDSNIHRRAHFGLIVAF